MHLKLISAHCENFKSFKEADIYFGEKITHVCGCNGLGKSTIAELIMWTLFGVGYDLTSNPKVRREVDQVPVADVPVVGEITMVVDEKEIIARKVQKRSTKKDGSYSDDNTYSINGVEKTLRDFQAYFEFNFDDLLMCMNIGAFLSKKPIEMREFLFKLPKDISVKDIVLQYPEFSDLAELMDKYSVEEISAMNKASIAKLNKEIAGYPGRIDEVNRQIVEDVDTAEMELQKISLMDQIVEIEHQEEDSLSQAKELETMSKDILELQFQKSEIERMANSALIAQRQKIQERIDSVDKKLRSATNDCSMAELDIQRLELAIQRKKKEKVDLITEYNSVGEATYPEYQPIPALTENDLNCPTCGQELPEDMRAHNQTLWLEREEKNRSQYELAKANFEESKAKKLVDIVEEGNRCKKEISKFKDELAETKAKIESVAEQKALFYKEIGEAKAMLEALPIRADLSENQEYEALVLEIQKKEEAMRSANSGADYRAILKEKKAEIQSELDNVKNQIARVMKNAELEDRIEFLRNEHAQKEQAKANCEKILVLLEELDKKKNELMVDDINRHFGGRVTWDLFAFAKNGGYKKDYCEPCIDGYLVRDTANHGRKIEAMLIIALTIQKIVGIQAPVILDDGESLDPWRIPKCKSQLIVIRRTDDKELRFEVL